MLSLIANRLLLLIPTLMLILICTYALSTYAPGDEVAQRLELAGESTAIDLDRYDHAYRSMERNLGLAGPKFYLSIVPSYHPKDPYDVVPVYSRQTLVNLNSQVKDWSKVHKYYLSAKHLLSIVRTQPQYRELQLQVNRMLKIDRLSKLSSLTLEAHYDEDVATAITRVNQDLGLLVEDRSMPYPVLRWHGADNQFHHWIKRFWSGDNISLLDGVAVWTKIKKSLRWTLTLSLISLLVSCVLTIFLAMWIERSKDHWSARVINNILYLLYSIPLFWLATIVVVFLTTPDYGSWTNLFPSIGIKYWELDGGFWSDIGVYGRQLILPLLCMVAVSLSYLTRQLVTDLNGQRGKPYATLARAKGVNPKRLRWRHLLPNSLMPYITIVTGALPRVLVGSTVIEVIFNIPGTGKLLLDSIYQGDWPVIFSIILIVGVLTVLSYLLADILYARFFPHIMQTS